METSENTLNMLKNIRNLKILLWHKNRNIRKKKGLRSRKNEKTKKQRVKHMTTDHIQTAETVRTKRSYLLKTAPIEDKGFELTRHESFLNGSQDMFDILQARENSIRLIGWQKS